LSNFSNAPFTRPRDDVGWPAQSLPGLGTLHFDSLNPMQMTSIARHWATPVVMATFTLMAGTGVLMFFHWHSPLQKDVHEWLGWGMVAAVVLHLLSNLPAFKRHFSGQRLAVGLLVAAVLVLVGTALVRPAEGKGPSVSAVAVQALARAPLHTLAEVFGLPVPAARQALASAGLELADDQSTLEAAAHGSRERVGQGLRALQAARAPAAGR
jgi:hypothetical protein